MTVIDYLILHPTILKDPAIKSRFKSAYKRELKARKAAGQSVQPPKRRSSSSVKVDKSYEPSDDGEDNSEDDRPGRDAAAAAATSTTTTFNAGKKRKAPSAGASTSAPMKTTASTSSTSTPQSRPKPKPKPKPRTSSSATAPTSSRPAPAPAPAAPPKASTSRDPPTPRKKQASSAKKRKVVQISDSDDEDQEDDLPYYTRGSKEKPSSRPQPAPTPARPRVNLQTELSATSPKKRKLTQQREKPQARQPPSVPQREQAPSAQDKNQDLASDELFGDSSFAGGADFGGDLDDMVYDPPPAPHSQAAPAETPDKRSVSGSEDDDLFQLDNSRSQQPQQRTTTAATTGGPRDLSPDPAFWRAGSRQLSPDPDFYASGLQLLDRPSEAAPTARSGQKSGLFFDSDHSGEMSPEAIDPSLISAPPAVEHSGRKNSSSQGSGGQASRGKTKSQPIPSSAQPQVPRASASRGSSDEIRSPRRSSGPASRRSPSRELSPVRPSEAPEEEEDEFDALFDGPRRPHSTAASSAQPNAVLGGARVMLNWELNQRTVDFDFLEKQVASFYHISTAVPPNHRKGQKLDIDDHVNAYWGLDQKYGHTQGGSRMTRLQELLAGRTAVIFAPKWSESTKKEETTTQDITAIQLLLLKRGADEVCGASKLGQATMVFIHMSELTTIQDLETLIDNPEMNKIRRTKEQVEFAIFGTRVVRQRGSSTKYVPVFRRIWHMGAGVTFTAPVLVLQCMSLAMLAQTSAQWSPVLKLWLHGRSRVLSDFGFQNDNSECVGPYSLNSAIRPAKLMRFFSALPPIHKSCTDLRKPGMAVVHPVFQVDPTAVLSSSSFLSPLWGVESGFSTNYLSDNQVFQPAPLSKNEEVQVLIATSRRLMMTYLETRRWYVVANAFQMLRVQGRQDPGTPVSRHSCFLKENPPPAYKEAIAD